MEMLKSQAGIDIVHVPYKGIPQAVPAAIAGEVQLTFSGAASSMAHLKSGRLKALAIGGKTRLGVVPDVPTFAEQGFPDIPSNAWFGLFAPAGTPRDVVMKLHGVIPPNNAVDVAKVKSALEKQAYDEKLAVEIPKHFKKLLEAANPKAIYDGPPNWRWSGDAADATNEILRSNIQPAAATTPAPAAKKPGGM